MIKWFFSYIGDGNVNSKKDREIRSKELYELAAPHILKYLAEHLIELIHEGGTRYKGRCNF